MSTPAHGIDLAPILVLLLLGTLLAAGPLAWVWLRHRSSTPARRLHGLTVVTLFLTFDLVLFGAFTRLTDSGLGCPDWPGCYGSASPLGATAEINAAENAMPTGPVTHSKAWIEMIHRYLASGVGLLILVLAVASWIATRRERLAVSPWWPSVTLVWVCLQGAFGALTVTMKLYPAIVTLHLLGGIVLLMLLAVQAERYRPRPWAVTSGLRRGLGALLALVLAQVLLGGWVSTNYAVLACSDFPTCQAQWWPPMDFGRGFTLVRALGVSGDGSYLPFPALTAIHMAHRLGALVTFCAIALIVWRLLAEGSPHSRQWAWTLGLLAGWQLASGLSNVILGWPLVAAVAHTAGAAALVVALSTACARARIAQAGRAHSGVRQGALTGAIAGGGRAS